MGVFGYFTGGHLLWFSNVAPNRRYLSPVHVHVIRQIASADLTAPIITSVTHRAIQFFLRSARISPKLFRRPVYRLVDAVFPGMHRQLSAPDPCDLDNRPAFASTAPVGLARLDLRESDHGQFAKSQASQVPDLPIPDGIIGVGIVWLPQLHAPLELERPAGYG